MSAYFISIDDHKKRIRGYTPQRAERFHTLSAKMADKDLMKALKERHEATVILLCGGSASGKTEFISEYLQNDNVIVFDSTLPTPAGAQIKLRNIKKSKKKAEICAILPDDLQRSFYAFLGRDRRFKPKHFYRTHAGARETLLYLSQEHPEVPIRLYESSYGSDGVLRFRPIEFENHQSKVEYLQQIQYNEMQIAQLANPL